MCLTHSLGGALVEAKDLEQEKQWLKQVYRELDHQLAHSVQSTATYREQMRKIRSSLWEDYGLSSASSNQMMDVAQQITELRQRGGHFGIQHRLMKQLKSMEKTPYFGRMDFHEEGLPQVEAMYIGISSLVDQTTGLPLVYDWRAPVSSMFYDYGLGAAEYEGPGGVFRGEISLKRQYRIKDRELVYMFDNELKIDDEVLQEALSQAANEKMRTIVNTIQREQNQAIRNDRDSLLLVEGPAGSGKTSVALHRIAFLLYKYRDSISSENIVIFSPNRIFSDYISHVLPELGEENVHQTTFQDYAEPFLGWEYDMETMMEFLEDLLQNDTPTRNKLLELAAFKSSQEFQQILAELINYVSQEATQFFSVKLRGQVVITGQEQVKLFVENYNYLPVHKRLDKIHQRIIFLLRPIKKELRREVFKEVAASPVFEDESWWTIARETIRRVKKEVDPLRDQLDKHLKVDSVKWYQRLWQDHDLWSKVAGKIPIPLGGDESLASLGNKQVSFEDITPLLYLRGELEGYPVKREIRHVIVDEVQDYSPLQLHILTKIFPRAKFTLVGDIFQSLNPYIWQTAPSNLKDVFSNLEMETVQLTKSYRSTQEIFHFCNGILKTKSTAETVLRTGPKPVVTQASAENSLPVLETQITNYRQAGHQTIAIICPTVAQCQSIYDQLKQRNNQWILSLLAHEKATYKPGIIVVPVYLAKGLEFDAVILPEVGRHTYGQEYQRRLLYVACSRALHALSLIYTDNLSPFIRELPARLYEHEEAF